VEKLVYGGDGLGRLEGRVVLAPFALPGERIRAQTEREKPGLLHARTLEVLEPSTERVVPPCPVFGRCGGCHYQHARYEYQLQAKRDILADALRRVGKLESFPEIAVVAGEPRGDRNSVQLHVERGAIGYREARSHRLCPIHECPISSPAINQAIAALNGMLHDSRWPSMIRALEIFTDEQQVQLNVVETERPVGKRFFEWCAERIPGLVEGALDYNGRFRVSRNSFFQINRFLLDPLVETAVQSAQGNTAFDLYAGVGLFASALASKFDQVIAVEDGSAAVRDLQYNAERGNLTNVRAELRSVEEFLTGIDRPPDFILLDPPRTGLGKAVVRRLTELRPPRMVMVACDPATLARDLAGLVAAGYSIDRLTLVDLFPQTYHMEVVVHTSCGDATARQLED
jgi:23S rRNA (uracil1939-C5)-methyltransferase